MIISKAVEPITSHRQYIEMQITSMQWVGVRQSTLVTVFLSYLLNFTLQWIARQSREEKIVYRIRNIHLKVLLYGLAALFGCNLHQGGLFQALMSWLIFIAIATLHYLNLKDTEAKKRAIADCLYYALLVIWFAGVIVDYALNG